MFFKLSVLKNFSKFTGKHLCQAKSDLNQTISVIKIVRGQVHDGLIPY